VAKAPDGFVSLRSLKPGAAPAAPMAEIRRIYFKTTKKTIEHDFAHAIELLKSLPSEEEREKAHVYMEGLAELRKEWMPKSRGSQESGTRGNTGADDDG
jgi:phage terminase small subunit